MTWDCGLLRHVALGLAFVSNFSGIPDNGIVVILPEDIPEHTH